MYCMSGIFYGMLETYNTIKVSQKIIMDEPMSQSIQERILEHARDRFFASGFSKVTMDELAAELGISKKTMYEHYQSKDELIDRVITCQMAEMSGAMNAALKIPGGFIDKLYTMWTAIGRMACRISKNILDDMRRHRPDLWKKIEELRKKVVLENFTRLIDEGIGRGLVRTDVNKEVVVLMYLSSIQGVVNPEILADYSFSAEEALKTILSVVLDGILTEKARQQFHRQLVD